MATTTALAMLLAMFVPMNQALGKSSGPRAPTSRPGSADFSAGIDLPVRID
ncbi:MAG: hypothetical protein P4L84_24430 [Isosphaeraceae bacterium]|nr:hypothetical protein [Isosphaeraceae bacterium]